MLRKSPGRPRLRKCLQEQPLLILILKVIDRFSRIFNVLFHPSIKLVDGLVESGFASSRFPGLEIACNDEVLASDLHHRNAIFLNDSAEMARRIAGLKRRARDVEKVTLRLALNCWCAHLDPPVEGLSTRHANHQLASGPPAKPY